MGNNDKSRTWRRSLRDTHRRFWAVLLTVAMVMQPLPVSALGEMTEGGKDAQQSQAVKPTQETESMGEESAGTTPANNPTPTGTEQTPASSEGKTPGDAQAPPAQPEQQTAPTKSAYDFQNDSMKVTATLEDPAAIPDDATLQVRVIDQAATDGGEYNYGAYLAALNEAAGASAQEPTYSASNTLLYDVAFMRTDPSTGEVAEVQPTTGAVTVRFEFLKQQLSGLRQGESTDLKAFHLPVANDAKAATTAKTTGISAENVSVEELTGANFTSEGDSATLRSGSFSAFALAKVDKPEEAPATESAEPKKTPVSDENTASAERPSDAKTPERPAAVNSLSMPTMTTQDNGSDTLTLNMRLVDYRYQPIAPASAKGIDASKFSVRLENKSRNNASVTQAVTLDANDGTFTLEAPAELNYQKGDNVTATLIYDGKAYESGNTISQYNVIISDDSVINDKSNPSANTYKTTITIRQFRPPTITVNYVDVNGAAIDPFISESETYSVVAKLMDEGNNVLATKKVQIDKTQGQSIVIDDFGEGKYLTEGRHYTVEVQRGDDTTNLLGDEAVLYWEENICELDIAGSCVASSPEATVRFEQMPQLTVASKLLDTNGTATQTAPGTNYYVLSEATVGTDKFYALTPLVTNAGDDTTKSQYNSNTAAHIATLTRLDQSGGVVYRGGNESMEHYLVASSKGDLTLNDMQDSSKYSAVYRTGQQTAEGYTVKFDMAGAQTTATLQQVTQSEGSPITVDIKLYKDSNKTVGPADPAITEDLYMLTTLKPKGDSSGSPLAWSITALSNAKDQLNENGTTRVTIDASFNLANSEMKATGGTVNFDPNLYDFTLRLYRKTGNVDLPNSGDGYNIIRTAANANDTIPSYDFIGTTKGSDNKTATLELHKSYKKTYRVRFNINPAGLQVATSDYYYLYVEATHGSDRSYFLMPLTSDETQTSADVLVQYIDSNGNVVSKWQDSNGNVRPITQGGFQGIDGTWKTTAYLIKGNGPVNMNSAVQGTNSVRLSNGQNIKDYTIDIQKMTYSEDAGNRRDYTSIINLNKINVENKALTPFDVLGNASEFGITAGRYEQNMHTETNFAVKSVDLGNHNIDIDGSGDNPIPFVVGTIKQGTELWLSGQMHVPADVFVGTASVERVKSTSPKAVNKYPTAEATLEAQVQNMIDAGIAMSHTLASKTTIAPQSSASQYTLDTTGFPDNSTIYVNADGIMNAISTDGGLKINKLPGQSIVFNISQPASSSASPLRIGEFTVNPNDPSTPYGNYPNEIVRSTTAALDGDPTRNKRVDDVIFEHITFNVTNAEYVHLNNTAGLFLLAKANEVTQQNGSGWILAGGSDGQGGTVTSNSEWHFYRHTRLYKAKGSFTIKALKKLVQENGQDATYENKGFTFKLYEYDETTQAYKATPLETAVADATGNVYFSSVRYDQTDIPLTDDQQSAQRTFKYKIEEVIPEGATVKDGVAELDGIKYNAQPIELEVLATNTRDATDSTTGKITTQLKMSGASDFVDPDENEVYNIGNITNTRDFVKVNPGAKKNADYPWEEESFKFTLTGVSARDKSGNALSTVPMPEGSSNGSKTVEATSSAAVRFGDITYGDPGTYTYTIAEDVPANATATIDGVEYTYAQARQEDSGLSENKIQGVVWKLGTISYDPRVHNVVVTVKDTNPMTATVADGTLADITDDPTVTFVNKKDQTGSLKVRKQVTVDGQATTGDFVDGAYTFKVVPDASGGATSESEHTVVINIKNGQPFSATVDGNAATIDAEGYVEVQSLKEGLYSVTETTTDFDKKGITVTPAAATQSVTVVAGKTADATPADAKAAFVNNLTTGGLKIQKVVVENEGKSISAGAATVTAGDYVFTVYTDSACTQALKDASGADVTVTLHLDGVATSVTSNEIAGLKPGDYWVKETSIPNNGTAAINSPAKITVEAGKTGTQAVIASITNNLNTGNLEVKKVVKSDVSADHTRKYPIKVELQGDAGHAINGTFGGMTFTDGVANLSVGDNESIRATGLPAGISYVVTETLSADDGQVFDAAWTGNTSDSIVKGQTKSATVTNTRKIGEIKLNKELLSDATADQNTNFEFVVLFEEPISGTYSGVDFQNGRATVTVKANQTVTISRLPIGQRYSITESTAAGFELTGITVGSEDQTSTKKATGTVSVNPPVVKFTNRRLPGGLNVTKTVNSSTAADKQKQFTFTVTLYQDAAHTKREESVNGASGIHGDYGVTFDKGYATFTLTDGQTKEIRNLPRGVYYVVEEQRADGFQTTAYDQIGEITATVASARFYNDKDEGGLRVYKRVNSKLPADKAKTKTYPITITLSDTSINNAYPASGLTGGATTLQFTNGVANVNLYDGQVVTVTGLAKGIGYTVSETLADADAQNFNVSYDGQTGTIADAVKTAGVINDHKPGKLTVEKKVESNQDSDKTRKFDFTVTLYRDSAYTTVEDTITGDFGGMTFSHGVASFSLSKDQTAVAEDLPRGVYYKVEEATPTGYVLTKTGSTDGMIDGEKTATFTNMRTYVSASVQKIWNDDNNHDGIRPTKLLVDLQANGRTVSTVTLPLETAMAGHDAWYYQIDNLPMYDDAGNQLTYTWTENNVPDGYTLNAEDSSNASIFSTTLTNSHTNEKTTKTVKKVWDDNSNQDGVITDETQLVVALMADGQPALGADGQPIVVTLTRANNWTATVENLPKFRADSSHNEIVYTWTERDLPTGYKLTSTTTVSNTTTLTNSYKPRQTEASIEKVWDDANDQDRVRPASITVTLNKTVDGTTTKVRDVVLNAANSWKATVTPLPVKEDGKDITYTWAEESVPDGYTLAGNVTSGTLTTITNKHKPIPTSMEVKKIWRDGEDRDKLRQQYLTVSLMKVAADGSLVDTGIKATLNEGNDWHAKVEGLPKYDQGKEITYVWTEPDIEGYSLVMTYNSATLQTLTNVHVPETTTATVKKVWAGNGIDDTNKSKIPASLQVALLADGMLARDAKDNPITVTLNAANNWEATVTGLFKKDGGKDITYTWDETDLPEGFVLTNTEKTAGDTAKGEITTLTNTLKTGGLQISKNVVSDAPADKSAKYQFHVELSDKTINGEYGGMTFANGVAEPTITVNNGEGSVTAESLPVGITYSITEAKVIYSETDQKTPAQANMTVEVTEATGEISADKTSVTTGTIVEDANESADGNQPSSAAFQNTRNKGDLKLNKKLVSDAAADKTNKFEFTVTLSDTNVSGSFELEGGSGNSEDGETWDSTAGVAKIQFTNGVATVKLVGGQTKTIKGLPAGMGYTVTEANVPSGIAVGITDDDGDTTDGQGTIVANNMKTVTITNTRAQGGFTLSKELISDRSGEENVMFTFVVTLSDTSISGTYGTAPDNSASAAAGATIPVTFTRGRALVLLKKDQTATVSGLPTGITYTITEPAAAGFSLTGITVDNTAQGSDAVAARQVTKTVSETASAIKFANSREPGQLNVYKFVRSSTTADHSKKFKFTVTLTGLSDEAKNKEYDGNLITLNSDQTVSSTETRKVQFTNGVATFELTDLQEQTIEGLPQGVTYSVVEDNYTGASAGGFIAPVASDSTGTISANPSNAVFLNSKTQGALVLYKQVDPTVATDQNKSFKFVIRLHKEDGTVDTSVSQSYGDVTFTNGVSNEISLKAGTSKYIEDLPANKTYTVQEVLEGEDANLFNLEWVAGEKAKINDSGAISESGTIDVAKGTIGNNMVAMAGAKNTRKPGKLSLTKVVKSGRTDDRNHTYDFVVKLYKDGSTDLIDQNVDTGISGTFGDMTFDKGVANVSITVTNGVAPTIVAEDLPVGIPYSVEETYASINGMTPSMSSNDTGATPAGNLMIRGKVKEAADNILVTCTNTRVTAGLAVKKAVVSSTQADHSKKYTFTVTLDDTGINGKKDPLGNDYGFANGEAGFVNGVASFELADNENKEFTNLPVGVRYTVTEETPAGFRTTWDGRTREGEIATQVSNPVEATNTRIEGSLFVNKIVRSELSSDTDGTKKFKVRVSLFKDSALTQPYTEVDGDYPDSKQGQSDVTHFTEGISDEVEVSANKKLMIDGLPSGAYYKIEEVLEGDDANLYSYSWSGQTTSDKTAATGMVPYNYQAQAHITNTRKPGGLDVTKHVTSSQASDNTRPFNFRVTLYSDADLADEHKLTAVNGDSGVNGAYGVKFNEGVADFTLTKDQTQKIKNLPLGTYYKVEEYAASNNADALKAYTTTKTIDTTGEVVDSSNRVVKGQITTTPSKAGFTNDRTETRASFQKVWDDNNDQDGKRPDTIYVNFTAHPAGGTKVVVTTAALTAKNNWHVKIEKLPTHDDAGKEITYDWAEPEENWPAGYELELVFAYDIEEIGGLIYHRATFTNKHTPERTQVSVRKIWNDENNQDGVRPQELTVKLLANGEEAKDAAGATIPDAKLKEDNQWSAKVDNLPKYKEGKEIVYSWVEVGLGAEYELTNTQKDTEEVSGVIYNRTTFTNTHKPYDTSASVRKVWDDAENQDALRPTELVLTLKKTVNGSTTPVAGTYMVNDVETEITDGKVKLTAANNWAATVSGLPLKENGATIRYSWDEESIPTGYTYVPGNTDTTGDRIVSGTLTTITNHHKPREVSARIKKVWNDNTNQDGVRPYMLSVALMKSVEGDVSAQSATEVRSVTLSPAMVASGTSTNEWAYTIDNLPENENGKKLNYYWIEKDLPTGYIMDQNQTDKPDGSPSTDAFVTTITNLHEPEKTTAQVQKVWSDFENRFGVRPESITVNLLADGQPAKYADGQEVAAVTLNASNNWKSAVIENLPKYRDAGTLIKYTWDESTVPENYTLTGNVTDAGLTTLTNSIDKGRLRVYKAFDGKVGLNNLADAEKAAITFTVTGPNGYSVSNTLDKFEMPEGEGTTEPSWLVDDLMPGTYTVTETGAARDNYTITTTYSVENGEASVVKNGTADVVVTNTYTRNPVKASVTKVWDDMDNKYANEDAHKRPTEIQVVLNQTVNGETTPVENGNRTLNEGNNWTATVEGLPYATEDDQTITYSWSETEPTENGYMLASNDTVVATDGSTTTTLNNHKLRGKLRFTKTVHSPKEALTMEQRKLITFEVKGAHIDRTGTNAISLAEMTPVATRRESAPSTQNTDQGITAQAEGDAPVDTSYVATDYVWESDWLPLSSKEDAAYTVKEVNSMYQWIDTRTYRVDDGETQESKDGVSAQVEDMKTTNVWISDTLVPAPLVISKQLNSTKEGAADTEFTFNIEMTIDESKDVAAARNTTWKDAEFPGTLTTGTGEGATSTESPVKFSGGKATVKLKGGQSLKIEYLPMGVDYTITEVPTKGFVLTNVEGTGTPDLANGSISHTISSEQVEDYTATFTNEDEGVPTANLQVTKQVVGGNYTGNEDFSFKLTKKEEYREAFTTLAKDSDVLPSNTTVTTKAGGTATFDPITYTEPGWYFYNITEVEPTNKTAGMSYDTYDHMVLVRVEDDLSVNVTYGLSLDTSKYVGLSGADLLNQLAQDMQDGTASQNVKDNKLTITNHYTPPYTPPSTSRTTTTPRTTTTTTRATTPRTSDDTNWLPVAALAVAGVGIVAFALIRRRKQ